MKIILHIGVHKTGTSALQQFLHQNKAALQSFGFSYFIPWASGNNHHRLAVLFNRHSPKVEEARRTLSNLVGRANQDSCHTTIISSEVLCELSTDMTLVKSLFEKHDIRIIAYIRSPYEIFISAYSQLVTEYKTRRKVSILEPPPPYDVSYLTVLQEWFANYSPGVFTLCPFDKKQFSKNSLFADFLVEIGITKQNEFCLDIPGSLSNISLPLPIVEILRHLNAAEMDEATHRQLINIFSRIWTDNKLLFDKISTPLLNEEEIARLYDRSREALSLLAPYFRPGFDPTFLVEPPTLNPRVSHT